VTRHANFPGKAAVSYGTARHTPTGTRRTVNNDGGMKPQTQWHAVSILFHGYGCEAVRMLGDQRFLASQAPRLPLAGCPAVEACRCKYKHHEDRRGSTRRREDRLGLPQRRHTGAERRVASTRRQSDWDDCRYTAISISIPRWTCRS